MKILKYSSTSAKILCIFSIVITLVKEKYKLRVIFI
jgi:hypothetical protein